MNFYPFHIGDYISHTHHLTDAEDLAYRRMIDLYYQREKGFLSADWVARKIKSTPEIVKGLLEEFFEFNEEFGFWANPRADIEIAKYHAIQAGGRKGAAIRWHKDSNSPPNAPPMQTKNQEPITKNQELITSNNKCIDHFNEFWLAYPKKVGKESARKAWDKIRPNIEVVLNALAWQKESDQWFKNGGQFVPNPATYLNQHRFDDERPSRLTF